MPTAILVRRRGFHQVDELIAEFDESVARPFSPQGKIENLAVKGEGLVDVADFQGDMADADEPRLRRASLVDLVMRVPPAGRCGPPSLYMLIRVHVFAGARIGSRMGRGRRVLGGGDHSPRRAVMDMITKLPEMSDDALVNLRTNAKRLQQSGNPS